MEDIKKEMVYIIKHDLDIRGMEYGKSYLLNKIYVDDRVYYYNEMDGIPHLSNGLLNSEYFLTPYEWRERLLKEI